MTFLARGAFSELAEFRKSSFYSEVQSVRRLAYLHQLPEFMRGILQTGFVMGSIYQWFNFSDRDLRSQTLHQPLPLIFIQNSAQTKVAESEMYSVTYVYWLFSEMKT